jgi:hypothetical protein
MNLFLKTILFFSTLFLLIGLSQQVNAQLNWVEPCNGAVPVGCICADFSCAGSPQCNVVSCPSRANATATNSCVYSPSGDCNDGMACSYNTPCLGFDCDFSSGNCSYTCNVGWQDANGVTADGCEAAVGCSYICDGTCPLGCTVTEDPDCGPCQGGNNCCGLGCDSSNDSDCLSLTCETNCSCVCPPSCSCPNNQCQGGLVTCGRNCDNPCTATCECCSCTLCHLFVMLKRIIDTVTLYIIIPVGILMAVIGGVLLLTSSGDPERVRQGKTVLKAAAIGLVIFFSSWLIVNTVIVLFTPAGSPFQNWYTITCPVP